VTVEWKLEGGEDVSDEVQPRSCLSGLCTNSRKCVAAPTCSVIISVEGGRLRPRGQKAGRGGGFVAHVVGVRSWSLGEQKFGIRKSRDHI